MKPASKLRIVVVEDNSADVFLIEEALRLHEIDFELLRFEGGEEALEHLRAPPVLPDLILLDLHIPGTDGAGILRSIRAQPRLAGVPVVILTGALREHLRAVDLSGAACIVHKSMDLDEYLQNVAWAVIELQLAASLRSRAKSVSQDASGLPSRARAQG